MTPAAAVKAQLTALAANAQRNLVGLVGLLCLAAGAFVIGFSLFGADRAARPVLDLSAALDTLRSHQTLARAVAVVAGVVLLVLGLLWAARTVKPEYHPNFVLDPSPDSRLEVSASAITDALEADAAAVNGVKRARAHTVGDTATPVVQLNLWLEERTDICGLYHDLDAQVLTPLRDSLGIESLPTAVHMELEAAPAARLT